MRLLLLGSPTLQTSAGSLIEFETRKAIALLAYLALHDQPFQRDTLAVLLWPELDQSRARAALRRTLVPLTHALGENALLPTRDSLAIHPDFSLWVDVRAFETAINDTRPDMIPGSHGHAENDTCERCLTSLQTAISLYKGDFMAGFTLRDAPEFDNWQYFETDRYRRRYATALERLIPILIKRGEFTPAIENARAWLALDPLHEPAHRALMRLYAQTDQRGAALRQFRECVRILDEELGVTPLEETRKLYEEILENRVQGESATGEAVIRGQFSDHPLPDHTISQLPSQQVSHLPVQDSSPQALISTPQYPFTGRTAELATLLAAYQRPSPDGYFFAIHGEAGVGKTRLAEEFVNFVQRQGASTFSARCYPGQGDLAYSVFVEALRPTLSRPDVPDRLKAILPVWLEEAARLLPELGTSHGRVSPEGMGLQTRLFEGVRQLILGLSSTARPGVLFLDDLQWADAASLDLLSYLVRRLQDFPIFILGTWRSEGEDAAVTTLLAECLRAGTGQGFSLSRLTRADVDALARSSGSLSEALYEKLYQETEGLPFFVVEYLTAVRQGETWKSQTGSTELGPTHIASTPRGIQDLQRARIARLDEASRQLITTAAVLGRSFAFDTLRETSGRSEDETMTALEKLVARSLLVEKAGDTTPTYDFTHEKLRQVVYEDTSLTRRRLLHRRIAQSLIFKLYASPALIAHHLRHAGQETEAAEYAFRAGEHARKVYANAEALTHFQMALALGYPAVAVIHEAIGDLQTLRGDYRTAITSYETAAALVAPANLPQLELKLGNLYHRWGDYELATSYFQAGLELLEEQTAPDHLTLKAQLTADWSRTAAQKGESALARDLAHQALTLSGASPISKGADLVREGAHTSAHASVNESVRGQAYNILGMLARRDQNFQEATDYLKQALTIAEASGSLPAQAAALNNLALVYEEQGIFERAIEIAQTALDLCARTGDRHREAALRNRLADLFHANQQPSAALYHLKKAVEIFAEIGGTAGVLAPEIWKLMDW